MKYFKTRHEKNSARLTALIAVILLLLLFVVGTKYMDPPEEYGVAVNFGNSDFGKGKVQPLKPVKSEPRKIEEPPQPDVSKSEPTNASENKEDVLTQEDAESIAIKKQKQAEAKAKAMADAKAKAEADRIAKEKREQEEKKKKLDALIGGVSKSEGSETGNEGNDNKSGDKGQLDGNPYAASYFGGQGAGSGGGGYGLNGRGKASFKRLKQDCNESIIRVDSLLPTTTRRNTKSRKLDPDVRGREIAKMENAILSNLRQDMSKIELSGLGIPLLVLLILSMLILPLPPFLLDFLFTFNILLGVVIIMIAINSTKPLDFSSFPAILLLATMLRLGLNVASTRLVLVKGHEGPDAAGKVIEACGEFVIAGNYLVGFIIFTILMIINFIVVD